MIVSFIQYLIANEMAGTRDGLAGRSNNSDNGKFAAAKEIANTRRRNTVKFRK